MYWSDQNRNCCGNIFAVGMETLFSPPDIISPPE
ncbi:hypothetical protein X942_1775 [Burkholderia pseudomallei MSHR5596]|nr:hypothetical protein X942_1775 [Burkholderia pseudomallei MSHR5596]